MDQLYGEKREPFSIKKKKTDLFKDYDIETSPKADKDEIFARIKLCTNKRLRVKRIPDDRCYFPC